MADVTGISNSPFPAGRGAGDGERMILFRGQSVTSAAQPELASGSQLKTDVSQLRISCNRYFAIHSQLFCVASLS